MKTKLKVGERYYYEQVGSNAIITGTLIDKDTFERDRKVAGGTWHDKISDIQRELKPIKIKPKCKKCMYYPDECGFEPKQLKKEKGGTRKCSEKIMIKT